MPWFFSGNDEQQQQVRRAMNRFLNNTTSIQSHLEIAPERESRNDSRISRMVPVAILSLSDDTTEENLNLGVTRDLSSEGMAIVSLGHLSVARQLTGCIGNHDEFLVFLGERVRCDSIGYGFYETGIRIIELLTPNDCPVLRDFTSFLERSPPKGILEVAKFETVSERP